MNLRDFVILYNDCIYRSLSFYISHDLTTSFNEKRVIYLSSEKLSAKKRHDSDASNC